MKKLYAIYTVNNFMDMIYNPFAKPFEEKNPDIKIYNIMDDSLLPDTRSGGMTPVIATRMFNYAKAAEASGADGIIVTCTSVNKATKYIKPFLNIPMINIEEPVAQMAAENGKTIGILATLPTSPDAIGRVIREKADEMGKDIKIVTSVVDGAFDVLCNGDREEHDTMVRKALYELAKKVDVIAFAQISMSLIKFDPVDVPVYMIGESGFNKIKDLMNSNQ
jgi:Asp/Glu/hydantoin racemase